MIKKIIIQTSSLTGTAAHHLSYLIEAINNVEFMVVYSRNPISKSKEYYKRKFKKMFKIGLLGSLNGLRMRKWYQIKEIQNQPIDVFCENNNIKFEIVEKINNKVTQNIYKSYSPDLAISLGNPYIGQKIFSIPKFGMINIHHEILPEYQNAQSIIWQIYNNSEYTGYTIHQINKKIDNGNILYQEKVPIVFKKNIKMTVIETNKTLLERSVFGLVKVIKNFMKYQEASQKQKAGRTYTTPSLMQFFKIRNNNKYLYKQISKYK